MLEAQETGGQTCLKYQFEFSHISWLSNVLHEHYFTAGLYNCSIAETHGSLIPSPSSYPQDKAGAHGYAVPTAHLQRRVNGFTCCHYSVHWLCSVFCLK